MSDDAKGCSIYPLLLMILICLFGICEQLRQANRSLENIEIYTKHR